MSDTASPNIPELLKEVQTLLNARCRRRKYRLQVPKDGYEVEEDWVTLVVTPTKPGIRAYEYVEALSDVEKQVRARGHKHVLLVPAMAD